MMRCLVQRRPVRDPLSGSLRAALRTARISACAYAAHNRVMHMAHNLAEAARATGKNRTTILRAIKAGTISGRRDEATKEWLVEPAELHRVYPPVEASPRAHRRDAQMRQGSRATERELQSRIDAQDRLIATLESANDDLRRRLDSEAEERKRLTLILTNQAQPERPIVRTEMPKGAWRRFLAWRRGR